MKKLSYILLCAALAIGVALLRDHVANITPSDHEYLSALTILFSVFGYATIILIIRYVRGLIYGRS